MPEMKRFPQIPQTGPVTALLIKVLHEDGKAGSILTDEQLKEKNGGYDTSVGKEGYAYLQTAIKHVERIHGIVWRRQIGMGYIKCLSASESINVARSYSNSIGRRARRSARVLETIDVNVLDGDVAEFNALYAQQQMLASLSSSRTRKALADHQIAEPVKLSKLLEAMK